MDFRQLSHLYCNCLWTQHKNKDEEPEVIESEVNRTEAAAEEDGKDDTVKAVDSNPHSSPYTGSSVPIRSISAGKWTAGLTISAFPAAGSSVSQTW